MVKVKICGITNEDDARAAVDAGADALGFVFYPDSPRYILPQAAGRIARSLPPFVSTVGLFVNEAPEKINRSMEDVGLRVAQLHGDEPASVCMRIRWPVVKAVRVACEEDLCEMASYRVSAFLLDARVQGLYGGTGKALPWDVAVKAKRYGRIMLAGGLTPENVAEAVRNVRPYGVDVSTGVEASPGRKDHRKVARFIREAKSAIPY